MSAPVKASAITTEMWDAAIRAELETWSTKTLIDWIMGTSYEQISEELNNYLLDNIFRIDEADDQDCA